MDKWFYKSGELNMEKATIKLLIWVITTIVLCVLYVVWVKNTPGATSKAKALVALAGLLIEIFIGVGVTKSIDIIIELFPCPKETYTQNPTTITSSTTQIETKEDDNKEIEANKNTKWSREKEEHNTTQISLPTTSDNIEIKDTTTVTSSPDALPPENYTVSLSFEPIQFSLTDNNCDFRAYTSFKAEKVTLYCEVNGIPYGEFNMKTDDMKNWTFDACFYEENTFVITAVAESPIGEVISAPITVKYPF